MPDRPYSASTNQSKSAKGGGPLATTVSRPLRRKLRRPQTPRRSRFRRRPDEQMARHRRQARARRRFSPLRQNRPRAALAYGCDVVVPCWWRSPRVGAEVASASSRLFQRPAYPRDRPPAQPPRVPGNSQVSEPRTPPVIRNPQNAPRDENRRLWTWLDDETAPSAGMVPS